MNQEQWNVVDKYLVETLVRPDAALDDALKASAAAGLPEIQVSPPLGKLLYLLAKMQDARKILEIGTLGGYSTIWLARALQPDGKLFTLEMDAKHAEVARKNIARAGLEKKVEVRLGRALDSLPQLGSEAPFDFVFIDANKEDNPDYFQWAVKLARRGTVIVIDNVVRRGAVADAASTDSAVQGVRKMHDLIAAEPRVEATAIQMVGAKGYDGFTLARVLNP